MQQVEDTSVITTKEKKEFTTPVFTGPLDLLLHLIQENDINIYDIPIALITEQFLQYIEEHKAHLDEISEFYKMAADLLLIKSRMLLPQPVEFDEEYEDPREELVDRLIEYQKFKKYTEILSGNGNNDRFYIPRKENPFMIPFEDKELFKGVTLNDLFATFKSLMERVTPTKVFNVYEEVTVNEKIALMNELFETRTDITILDIIRNPDNPLHIICSFMAILEATKWKMILIHQDEPNGVIYIRKRPEDWDPELVDEYDREYDRMVAEDIPEDEDQDDFSVIPSTGKGNDVDTDTDIPVYEHGLVDEGLEDDEYYEDDGLIHDIYIGEEEEIDLDDDDDDEEDD